MELQLRNTPSHFTPWVSDGNGPATNARFARSSLETRFLILARSRLTTQGEENIEKDLRRARQFGTMM